MASKPAPDKTRRHKETVPTSQVHKTPSGGQKRGGKPQPQPQKTTDAK